MSSACCMVLWVLCVWIFRSYLWSYLYIFCCVATNSLWLFWGAGRCCLYLCLCVSVFCKMEELILCENLGMWDKHMQVVWYVFETEYMYIVISLHICSVVGNCSYIWGLWRIVCIMSLCVYSRGMAFWRNICQCYGFLFFSKGLLGLYILRS